MRRRRGGRRRGRQRGHASPYGCPRARLGGQGRGTSRECSAGASFWVHGTAAGPVREPLRARSLDGPVGGRYSTTKAPDAAAKGPPAAPGLVVGVGCASRGGEAARTPVEAREVRIGSAAPDLRRGPPGRRMGLGVPEKLRGAVFFACVYRFMSWTGPGNPLTARGGCYGAVMI